MHARDAIGSFTSPAQATGNLSDIRTGQLRVAGRNWAVYQSDLRFSLTAADCHKLF
jgi:hypothetical protein